MQINRHNYETFFLLYVDKELSAAERKAVDAFVQDNPDLQMELAMLQQTVVKPDSIVLNKKDWLYVEEDIAALQENLMLYSDDELTAADKKSIESMLQTDKAAIAEWNILQQTKLQPNMAVVFEDKSLLYRKEAGRVVVFKWWRVAAAAVLLGFGIYTGVSVYKNYYKTKAGAVEVVKEKETKSEQTKKEDAVTTVESNAEEKSVPQNIVSTSTQYNNQPVTTENNQTTTQNINRQNPVNATNNVTVQHSIKTKQDNNLPQPVQEKLVKPNLENINNNRRNETIAANVLTENNNITKVSGNNNVVEQNNQKEYTNNTIAASNANNGKTEPAVIATLVSNTKFADGANNTQYLDVDDDKQKRTALGGFLRKAKRVLERTTNVNPGEGIKVAGFEISL